MKLINNYIYEKLVINKNTGKNQKKLQYKYFPETKKELKKIINQRIKEEENKCDLNDIDVSEITDMSRLFENLDIKNIDISQWDVSKVENFYSMFANCSDLKSIGDISSWDLHSATNLHAMFYGCFSLKSIGDISRWNVSNVTTICTMFCYCGDLKEIGDLSSWDVSNVKDMKSMFFSCSSLKDIGDLNKWKISISNPSDYDDMFNRSSIIDRPNWYKGK